jgi:hypothetical protein
VVWEIFLRSLDDACLPAKSQARKEQPNWLKFAQVRQSGAQKGAQNPNERLLRESGWRFKIRATSVAR